MTIIKVCGFDLRTSNLIFRKTLKNNKFSKISDETAPQAIVQPKNCDVNCFVKWNVSFVAKIYETHTLPPNIPFFAQKYRVETLVFTRVRRCTAL
jgi:hypothetical protein